MPPPIPTFIDTTEAIDELTSYDSFGPVPDDITPELIDLLIQLFLVLL